MIFLLFLTFWYTINSFGAPLHLQNRCVNSVTVVHSLFCCKRTFKNVILLLIKVLALRVIFFYLHRTFGRQRVIQ